MTKKYYATRDGFVLGEFYKKGASVAISEQQAKYLSAPYGDDVSTIAPRAKPQKSASKSDK